MLLYYPNQQSNRLMRLLRKNGDLLREVFTSVCWWRPSRRRLSSSSRRVWMSFGKACSGSEIKVCQFAFGEGVASPKVETILFRRLSIQLSLGGLLSSRARLCLPGQKQCVLSTGARNGQNRVLGSPGAKQNAL